MGIPENQLYGSCPSGSAAHAPKPQKRKASDHLVGSSQHIHGKELIDLTADTPPRKRKKQPDDDEEKRLRRWRAMPPQSYLEIRDRALTQRMFVLDRQRHATHHDHPVETVSLAGTTGNIYSVRIDKVPSCDCPHARKGNQCKHIIYVLARVLRVSAGLEYQLAFISGELREIFEAAPPLPAEHGDQSEKDGNRKAIEGECPVCYEDFEPANSDEAVVYCKVGCGNNIHQACFKHWAAEKKGGNVTCPFCRAPWEGDEGTLENIVGKGKVNAEGYVNVANQLGISGSRDYSTYHQPWVRRGFGHRYY